MIVDPYERFFVRHDLCLRTPYDHGAALPILSTDGNIDVEDVVTRAIRDDRAKMALRNKDVIRLTKFEVRRDKGVAIFLFRRSDPDATTPVWENQRTRELREADKGEDDAITMSAHLFVELKTDGGPRPTHRAILEEIPGLGRTYVQGILGDVLRAHKYNYKDRRGKEQETYTLVDFLGVKSETIDKAMGAGSEIEYVELVKPPDVRGLDMEHIVPREVRWKLYIRSTPERSLPIINKIKKWAGKDWSDVRVRINMPEARSRLVSVARVQDAADVLFVRAVPVTVKKPLPACTENVNEELLSKAIELFKKG
ncbi:hypothetical protein [Bradyrhizobium sp. Arg816]|uniref:hypothetical protein n=1 Tax=Bradyrhizobium sp. Arg816 TaxID=2998491 RepID=UPI00249EAC24|nr:hypothetical protein [Bradyrhizobium sp. Arg816]MDI3566651.1 hypothetical protein [Bradyrhizobium sp. Arg816]